MFKKNWEKIILSVSIGVCSFAPFVWAAGILPKETGINAGTSCGGSSNCGNYSLNDFLQLAVNIANWILACVGAVALLFFVYGGFVFILSAGNEEWVKKGKTILLDSIIGLLIVFASYLIIRFSAGLLGANVDAGLHIKIK